MRSRRLTHRNKLRLVLKRTWTPQLWIHIKLRMLQVWWSYCFLSLPEYLAFQIDVILCATLWSIRWFLNTDRLETSGTSPLWECETCPPLSARSTSWCHISPGPVHCVQSHRSETRRSQSSWSSAAPRTVDTDGKIDRNLQFYVTSGEEQKLWGS